jgi:Mn2+/Fe2+ NRAMP family transporter
MVQILLYRLVQILIRLEVLMRARDIALLLGFGIVFWAAGTLWYEWRGPLVFETTLTRYWANFALTPIVTAAVCILVLHWLQIPAAQWSAAMLLVAIPGMIGEALLLSNFSTLMPRMHESSAGKYGAFLFATYALVLGIAEIATLRASQ